MRARGRNLGRTLPTALVLSAVVSLASAATIRWEPAEQAIAVEVVDAGPLPHHAAEDPAWLGTLAVFAEQAGRSEVPPMAGTWSRETDGRLRFRPRFPLSRGVRYRAEYRVSGAAPVVAYFELSPDLAAPTTVVERVFPTAGELPENQLKFYVHFSAPMSRGHIYDHIRLRDAAGAVIEQPFLELEEELWDATMTRLTLLIDPGRIKRGVKPLEDIGPVFEAGKNYAFTVGADLRDAAGRPLRVGFEKKFRIGPADRNAPDPAKWILTVPGAGSRTPLVVDFGEPMEHALASRMLRIVTKAGEEIGGEVSLGAEERTWRFTPDAPWRTGAHRLVIATTLEDLAGNNPGKPFDVDVFEDVQRRIETATVEVAFTVK